MTLETAQRLTQLRRERGYSQEEVADKLNVSRQAVSKWERAESSPDTDNLIALSQLYGVTLDELVKGPAAAPAAEEPAAPDDAIDPDNPLPHGSYFEEKARKRREAVPYPVLVATVYLVLGAVFGLWHPWWMLFLTIPLYYLPRSERSYIRLLGNPVMVTIIYLLLGFVCGWWHPGWVVFLLIPLVNSWRR
ncbi:MAG: helix-turn-helix domain-containing protein [Aristaeellaceae bacterium]